MLRAMGSQAGEEDAFLKLRVCYFALLILSKWEFWEEYVKTVKCLLQKAHN